MRDTGSTKLEGGSSSFAKASKDKHWDREKALCKACYTTRDMADETPKKVLVVEDEKFLSNLLKVRLEREGFVVLQAYDGEEGMKVLKEQQPALVVLDLVMPKMSGFEFLEQMSMDPQVGRTPVVVASNLGQDSDIEKAKRFGVVDYFVKAQIPIDQLATVLKGIIQSQK